MDSVKILSNYILWGFSLFDLFLVVNRIDNLIRAVDTPVERVTQAIGRSPVR